MKKVFTLWLIIIAFITITNAQTINIPDANFKAVLLYADTIYDIAKDSLGNQIKIDINNDGEIQQSEAESVYSLVISGYNNINSLEGINYFINLKTLICFSLGNISQLNISQLNKLTYLDCSWNNNLSSIITSNSNIIDTLIMDRNNINLFDIDKYNNIKLLTVSSNKLEELNIANSETLEYVSANNNNIKVVKAMNSTRLVQIDLYDIPIESINITNCSNISRFSLSNSPLYLYTRGASVNIPSYYLIQELTNCRGSLFLCCDEGIKEELLNNYNFMMDNPNLIFSTFCSTTTEDEFYSLNGNNKIDFNNNGCDENDIAYPNLKLKLKNTTDSTYITSDENGYFSINLIEGTYELSPILNNSNFYTISPTNTIINLPDSIIPSFCITPKGNFNDLKINVIPTTPARPGFSDATYKLVYKNQGTTTQNASVTFAYNEDKMDFITASQTPNSTASGLLSFNIGSLASFEQGSITITMRVNSPADNPAVNTGDVLFFTSTINNASNTDETPEDNTANLNQTVVGSYDPNDKTCLEGEIITPDLIGKPVNYLIRFENTGTANAENIVITDYIDLNTFDINTLQIVDASHSCRTVISNGNKLQFVFDNIQLPFTEPDKHGFVAFSINLLSNLQIGDSLKNDADIYFDFNLPITTNLAVSEINNNSTPTAIKTNNSIVGNLNVYPNPNKGQFNINLDAKGSFLLNINIYDANGKSVYNNHYYHNNQSIIPININNLANGIYVVKASYQDNIWSQQITIVK